MRAKVVPHPATQERFTAAAGRWMNLKKNHESAARYLWLGIMVANFSDDELALLGKFGYLSGSDHALLRNAGRGLEARGDGKERHEP